MKNVLLYFGSFNPIHRSHIALAEYAIQEGLCDEVILVVSPQNPHKIAAHLAPEMLRFEMAEMACTASKYPDKIKPSVVEFMLERPSYTVDTMRYLKENFGNEMRFSILMGCDSINTLHTWKEPEELLQNYPIYVYPRSGSSIERYADRVTLLEKAPLCDFSSTQVRAAVERGEDTSSMLIPQVEAFIREKGLYSTAYRLTALTAQIDLEPQQVQLYLERGMCYYRMNRWGEALNDFRRALELEPDNREAKQLTEMVYEILSFRYTDIYNP